MGGQERPSGREGIGARHASIGARPVVTVPAWRALARNGQTSRPGRKAAPCYTARPGWQKRKRVRKCQARGPEHDGNYTNRACQKYLQILGRSECGVTKDGRTSPREAASVQVGPWRLDRGLTFGRCEGTYENSAAATSALNRCPPPFAGARPRTIPAWRAPAERPGSSPGRKAAQNRRTMRTWNISPIFPTFLRVFRLARLSCITTCAPQSSWGCAGFLLGLLSRPRDTRYARVSGHRD